MLSLTGEYALRALIFLAQNEKRWPVPGKEIAARAGVPAKYLSMILSELVRTGVLESTRGKSGGFRLVKSSKATPLWDVVAPFEQLQRMRCPFGNQKCSDHSPCLAHSQWKKIKDVLHEFLQKTSLWDVAVQKKAGGKRAS
ncbi:MAG: Rrf2 family transcriptional regulator [Planctomycetota bacterium]